MNEPSNTNTENTENTEKTENTENVNKIKVDDLRKMIVDKGLLTKDDAKNCKKQELLKLLGA